MKNSMINNFKNNNLNYIAEVMLPSKSAYSIQVMKMCDAFSKFGFKVHLHVLNQNNSNNFKFYNCLTKFNIVSYRFKKNNFFTRLLFSLFVSFKMKNEDSVFYSRSIITGIFLAFIKKNTFIEIHHELKGFTRILFKISKNFLFFKKIKFVFITKNLKKFYRLNNISLVAGDAVDLVNFKANKSVKIKNTCVYTGSLSKGKGLEIILKVSKLLPKIKFHIYGDFSNSDFTENDLKKYSNIYYLGHISYEKIPKILNKYSLYLMPYLKKVHVRSNNIEVAKYMSPMKLFEYMAADGVIIASNLEVYSHILNKTNSILINKYSIRDWKNKIEYYFENISKFSYLSKNASNQVKTYTWEKRVNLIYKLLNNLK
jgi:hypothetical protein